MNLKNISEGLMSATSYISSLFPKIQGQKFDFGTLNQITKQPQVELAKVKKSEKKYNRYTDIYPYEFNCARLKNGSYVNASKMFLNMEDKNHYLIAAQAPNYDGICSFLKLLIELSIVSVVTIGQVKQGAMEKYWPDRGGSITYDQGLTLRTVAQNLIYDEVVQRKMEIIYENKVYPFNQYQLLFWKDRTAPQNRHFQTLLQIVNLCGRHYLSEERCLVHCSAGIGRTGVIITMVALQIMASKQQPLPSPEQHVFNSVKILRLQRKGFVQTPEQYQYLIDYEGYRRTLIDIEKTKSQPQKMDIELNQNLPKIQTLQSKIEQQKQQLIQQNKITQQVNKHPILVLVQPNPEDFINLEDPTTFHSYEKKCAEQMMKVVKIYFDFWNKFISHPQNNVHIYAIFDDGNSLVINLSVQHHRVGSPNYALGSLLKNSIQEKGQFYYQNQWFRLKESISPIVVQPRSISFGEGDITFSERSCHIQKPFNNLKPLKEGLLVQNSVPLTKIITKLMLKISNL